MKPELKTVFLFLLSLILGKFMYAQDTNPPSMPMPSGRRAGGQVPSIGHFYGKIVDAKTNKGLDGVSVQLVGSRYDTTTHSRKDTVLAGAITQGKGEFSFENLPLFGQFHLKVTAIGYKLYDQKIAFDLKFGPGTDMQAAMNAVDKDLGNIKLQADVQTLEQVVVTAEKPLIQLGIDRKVYNVEKDLSAPGGSATDVMRNVPSVAVDIDGNVTLRNSTPTIFVDGRPTTLTLDQIPADAIQSIEIITNPGAKYDASGGTSGILNIVLKKNRKAGYNGDLRGGIDQRGKYNLGGDLNVKQGKINVFANVNYNQRKSISPGNTTRSTFITYPETQLNQYDYNVNDGYFAFGRFGLDYLMDNRNTLSVSGTLVHGSFKPYTNSDLYVDSVFTSSPTTTSYTRRLSNTDATFDNKTGALSYKHTFPRAGEEWTADLNYSKGKNASDNQVSSSIYNVAGGPLSSVYNQQQLSSGTSEYITGQTDFTNPFSERSKLEAGARVAVRNVSSVNNFGIFDKNGTLVPQPLSSSNYDYHDRVIAGYVTYSNSIKNFGYQVGLRAESSQYNGASTYAVKDATSGNIKDTLGNFSNNYPVSLFPSIFLSQKLGKQQELQLNYTRRIDRPSFFQLFPYTDYSDSLNLSRGNPNLKPQFTNSFEVSYQKTYGANNTFLASVYYKYTTDLITRYQTKDINPITDSPVIINTYINATSSYVGGLELIGKNNITKWWDVTSNINLFTSRINAADSIQTPGSTFSYFAKVNTTFKIPKNFTLQISGDYTSKTVLPPGGSAGTSSQGGGRGYGQTVSGNAQGYSKPTGGVDASIRYEFLKNKTASLTLSVRDIFRTRVSDVVTTSPYFTQEVNRTRDPQFFRLQFNYRFGKFDVALFKRKNNKADQDIQNNIQAPVNQ
jgi:outer membrane receptor protein involved in Fe transport